MQTKMLLPILFFTASTIFAQTQNINVKSTGLTVAEKATIDLSKIYDFSGEQALAVKQIEIAKFKNLADIEALKAGDVKLFIQKHAATIDIADSEIRDVLDDRQRILFNKNTTEKARKLNATIASWQKQKLSDTVINQKLANSLNDE